TQLSPFFCESWVYSACTSVSSQCGELIAVSKFDPTTVSVYEGYKAELLHYARMQLDTLGFAADLIPSSINTSPARLKKSLPSGASVTEIDKTTPFKEINNLELKTALTNMESFDSLYTKLTNQAIKSFELGNRLKTVWFLKGDLAYLAFHRKNYAIAAEIWESISQNYYNDRWATIDSSILERLCFCYRELKQNTNFVRCSLGLISNKTLDQEDVKNFSLELNNVSKAMETPFTRDSSPVFKITVKNLVNKVGDDEDIIIDANVYSIFPCEFFINNISICLMNDLGGEETQIWFTVKGCTVTYGNNLLRLFAQKTAFPGNYNVEKATIEIGKLTLTYNLNERIFNFKKNVENHVTEVQLFSNTSLKKEKYFRIIELSTSIRVEISQPDTAGYNDSINFINVKAFARQHGIKDGIMTLSCTTGLNLFPNTNVQYLMSKITSKDVIKEQRVDICDGKLTLPKIDEGDFIEFTVPCTLPTNCSENQKVKVIMFYTDGKNRLYNNLEKVNLSKHFIIENSNLYLDNGSLIRLSVKGIDLIPVRICSFELITPPNFTSMSITVPNTENVIFQNQTLNFVYAFSSKEDTGGRSSSPTSNFFASKFIANQVHFNITYYQINEEIEEYIIKKLDEYLNLKEMSTYTGLLSYFFRKRVFPKLDYVNYAMTKSLNISPLDKAFLETQILFTEDEDVKIKILDFIKEFYQVIQSISIDEIKSNVNIKPKKLTYTFEPPEVNLIIVTADLLIPKTKTNFTIGERIECLILIFPPISTESNFNGEYEFFDLKFEVVSDQKHWMISGKTKFLIKLE
ncbi:hypothetical protein HK099_001109, partial [Clydaea vesicula]